MLLYSLMLNTLLWCEEKRCGRNFLSPAVFLIQHHFVNCYTKIVI